MAVKLKDIAAACGKDVSTVSRALRGDPRVLPATRKTIEALAQKMGYRPNLAARRLVAGRTHTLWFLLSAFQNPIDRDPLQAAANLLADRGYDLLAAPYQGDPQIFERLCHRLTQGVTDGAFVLPCSGAEESALSALVEQGVPLVAVDRAIGDLPIPTVTSANEAAAQDLARCAISRGCRDLLVSDGAQNAVAQARRRGLRSELDKHGGTLFTPGHLQAGAGAPGRRSIALFGDGQEEVLELLRNHAEPLRGAELTILTFDGWLGEVRPGQQVFVAVQDFAGIAQQAVECMFECLEREGRPIKREILVPIQGIEELGG